MLQRYARPQMVKIWDPLNRFNIWLEIELLAMESMAKLGVIPEQAANVCRQKASFVLKRIDEIEATTKHDVIAFLTAVAENIGPEARYMHQGLTSSDVLDTAFAVQLTQSTDAILNQLNLLLLALKKRAFEHKNTWRMGRSHGIHAEPTTFGLTLTLFYDEFKRQKLRLIQARQEIAVGKISGAVGTFANVDPQVEAFVCQKLGLMPAPISTQIINRDRHAHLFSVFAGLASSIENLATEIRHLQRTEVYEAEEFFAVGQKGSSAMPHKRNPVLSENLCGLARVVRGYASTALQNITLWHERDISHSSAERFMAPDVTITLEFMLARATTLIEKLLVYPQNMLKNLNQLKGLCFSQGLLLLLTQKGCSREEACQLVQKNAMAVWEKSLDFKTLLVADDQIKKFVRPDEIEALFNLQHHTKHVDTIFKRVYTEEK